MDYMFRIKLRKPADMSATDFYSVWLEEAEPSLQALEDGALKCLYKVAGRDEAVGIMAVDSGEQLDAIYDLPLWAGGHAHLVETIEWQPLRPHEAWVADLRRLSTRRAKT